MRLGDPQRLVVAGQRVAERAGVAGRVALDLAALVRGRRRCLSALGFGSDCVLQDWRYIDPLVVDLDGAHAGASIWILLLV
jgi:hypothetical protein